LHICYIRTKILATQSLEEKPGAVRAIGGGTAGMQAALEA
jgi:hypothetical protein